MLIQTASALWLVAALAAPEGAAAQTYREPKARRHFISVSYERQYVQPYGFASHPLAELLGQDVNEVHLETFQYRTEDGATLVNVLEYGKRAAAIGATVYPFGSSTGATLAIRGSIETLPAIRVSFTGPAPMPAYILTGGRAMDLGVGIDIRARRHRPSAHRSARRAALFRRGGRWHHLGPGWRRHRVQVLDQPLRPPGPAQRSHDPHQRPRNAHVLMSAAVSAWLAAAIADANARNLPQLEPLLQTLARSLQALRDADVEFGHPAVPEAGSSLSARSPLPADDE
jgi:hypothetical protein